MIPDAIPDTADRVPLHTSDAANRRIHRVAEDSAEHHAAHPEDIGRRLDALDREWDIERALEANASTLALVGVVLGATVDRRFLVLPAAVAGFLLQHAVQGWCPPLPLLRRLGFRTQSEIERERAALKALRGDFDGVSSASAADRGRKALQAAEA